MVYVVMFKDEAQPDHLRGLDRGEAYDRLVAAYAEVTEKIKARFSDIKFYDIGALGFVMEIPDERADEIARIIEQDFDCYVIRDIELPVGPCDITTK